jgi:hypothetical protein
MAKTVSFESLPREIRTALYRIDEPECFTVERSRHEAITVVNKRLSRVYKFVRKNKKLVLQLDKEINNLILLRNRKISAPTVLNRQLLKQYDMVSYAYVEGDVVESNTLPKHSRLLADAHRKLHLAFERDGKTKLAEWNSARMLKPIFSKTNAAEAGWASKYFELGVTIHAFLYEKKAIQRDLVVAYLNEYFEVGKMTERDVQLIELHVKLRFLEGATWHLLESKEDQLLNKTRYAKFVEDSWRKAERFDLAKLIK